MSIDEQGRPRAAPVPVEMAAWEPPAAAEPDASGGVLFGVVLIALMLDLGLLALAFEIGRLWPECS